MKLKSQTSEHLNLHLPPSGEPVALGRWARLESGHLVIITSCPSCYQPKVHEWPHGVDETLFSRRSCITCPREYPAHYWLKLSPGPKPPRHKRREPKKRTS